MSSEPLIRMVKVSHTYGEGNQKVTALMEISLSIQAGEFVAVTGPSGSGKTTLLHIAGGLLQPTGGSCWLTGRELGKMGGYELARLRNRSVGFVFQNFALLPRLTALQNVALPLIYAGVGRRERNERARDLLERVGLEARASHYPNAMSGGEQQRAAIARALVNTPPLLFADEPTGNLDSATGGGILDLFADSVGKGMTLVIVTHDPRAARRASRIINLLDSRIV